MRLARTNLLSNFFSSAQIVNNTISSLFQGQSTSISTEITLQKGDVFRVPKNYTEVRVLSGFAWLSVAGKDKVLQSGEKVLLASKNDAVLSALKSVPLILEVS